MTALHAVSQTPVIEAPIVNAEPTSELPAFGVGVNNRRPLSDVLRYSAGSFAGQSAVSGWLDCPEKSRLSSMGVRVRPAEGDYGRPADLAPAPFGTLNHALRAERLLYGPDALYALLDAWAPALSYDDYLLAKMMWRIYDTQFPLGQDGWEYLGVECEVRTKLKLWNGATVVRSVRYDTVIRMGGFVYSFECKTMRSGGRGALLPYMPQGMVQQALWNANEPLVAKYGRMDGVIFDELIKTKTPNCERTPPECFSRGQEKLALQYMRSPDETVQFFRDPITGRYPQMLRACWGRWNPCEYIPVCHEEAYGMYVYGDGREYDGR